MKKYAIAALACLMLYGCNFSVMVGDENKAAAEANKVIKAVYIDRDFRRAYDMCDDIFKKASTVDALGNAVLTMEGYVGRVKLLKAVSYMPNKDSIVIMYDGINERGASYHKIGLVGNAAKGYKVFGINVSESPEKGRFLKFKEPIVVE